MPACSKRPRMNPLSQKPKDWFPEINPLRYFKGDPWWVRILVLGMWLAAIVALVYLRR